MMNRKFLKYFFFLIHFIFKYYINFFRGSDQDEDPFIIERRRNRIQLDSVRAELKSLLARPIFPRGFSFK